MRGLKTIKIKKMTTPRISAKPPDFGGISGGFPTGLKKPKVRSGGALKKFSAKSFL